MRSLLGVLAGVGAVVVSAGCALPSRDNPSDPTVRPQARLAVVDYTAADGTCSQGFGPGQTWPEPAAVSRGHCLALDASASKDPKGLALAKFTFALLDTAGNVVQTFASESPSSTFVLGTALRLSLPVDRALTFSVTAADTRDYKGSATTSLVLLDATPVAVADPPRTIAVHGDAWAWDSPVVLDFDASRSHDADGDPLTYCWTFPETPGTEVCGTAKVIQHAVPVTSAGRYIVTLRVKDFPRVSDPDTEVITIGEPPIWVSLPGFTYERIDLNQETLALPQVGANPSTGIGLAFSPGIVVAEFASLAATGPTYATVGPFPGPTPMSSPVPLFGSGEAFMNVPPVVASSGNVVAFLGNVSNNFAIARVAVTYSAGNPVLVDGAQITVGPFPFATGTLPVRFAGDGAGNYWAGYNTDLFAVLHGTNAVVPYSDPQRVVAALAARPGTTEMWELQNPNPNLGSTAEAVLTRWTTPGGAHTDIPMPGETGYEMAWAGPDALWVATATQLRLEDARLLDAGATFDQASTLVFDGIRASEGMRVDPATGSCWLVARDPTDGSPFMIRAETDGRIAARTPATAGIAIAVDRLGVPWYQTPAGLVGSSTADLATGIAARVFVFDFYGGAQTDARTGGIFSPVSDPHALARVGVEGDLAVITAGTEGTLPNMFDLRASPDGSRVWAMAQSQTPPILDDLLEFVPGSTPVEERVVLDGTTFNPLYVGSAVLQPSGSTNPPFAWFVKKRGAPHDVSMISTAGVFSVVTTLSAAQEDGNGDIPAAGALLPSDDSLCLASADQPVGMNPTPIHVLRIQKNATVNEIATPSGNLLRVASSSEAGLDLCWVAYADGSSGLHTIIAVDPVGTIVHSFTLADRLSQMRPIANDTVYLTTRTASAPVVAKLHRISLDPAQTSVILSDTSVPIDVSTTLVRNGSEY